MAGLRDILKRAFGGVQPEIALAQFKERLHNQINDFKDNPESRAQLQKMLQSILQPLRQFNLFIVQPALNDNERLKSMAKQYNVNKIELKRVFKTAIELEEKIHSYFKDRDQVDQLVVTLRKVVNVLDEEIISELINSIDYNIDYGKIEKAYLDYQHNLQKAYNVDGLNRDLQGLMGNVVSGLKNAFSTTSQRSTVKPSDREAEARMLEPELQNLYDRYRAEGFTHEESMRVVDEKRDLDSLPAAFHDAYRTLRGEGQPHSDAIEYTRNLANKAQDSSGDSTDSASS